MSVADLLNSIGELWNGVVGGDNSSAPLPANRMPAWQQAITKPVINLGDKIVRGVANEANLNDLANAFMRINPLTAPATIVQDYRQGGVDKVVANQRIMAGHLAQMPTDLAATVPGLWALAGLGAQEWGGFDLPGAVPAAKASLAIRDAGEVLGEKIAGVPTNDSFLKGDPAQLAGNWTRNLIPAVVNLPVALPKVASGIKLVDDISNAALKTTEVISPILISKNPSPALIATNATAASVLAPSMEVLFKPHDSLSQTKEKIDSFSKGVTDSAAEGIKEAKTIQAGIGGQGGWEDVAAFGLLAAASIGAWKRDVAYRALSGLDKGETTAVPLSTIIREQMGDSLAPIDYIARKQLGAPVTMTERLSAWMNKQDTRKAQEIGDAYESRNHERHGASIDTKLQQAYEFGELPDSGIKITPLNDTIARYKSLTPDQQQMAVDALNARHELDTRQRITNANVPGAYIKDIGSPTGDHLFTNITRLRGWNDAKVAHNMYDTPTADLFSRWNGRVNDPAVARVVDEYIGTMQRIPQYLYEQRAITKKEMLDLKRQNPHYVATELAKGNSHLMTRNPEAGKGLLNPGNPFEEIPKYFDEVVRFAESNKIRRTLLGHLMRAADAGDGFAKSLLGRRDMNLQTSANAADLTVRFRDINGVARDQEVLDPVLRRALRNVGRPGQLSLISGGMKGLGALGTGGARFFENAAVGPLAAATGSIFAPVGAGYAATFGTALRDRRLGASGWLDKAVQTMTAKVLPEKYQFGVRGDVLTMAPDVAFRAAQGVAAVVAQRTSRALKNSIISDGRMAKLLGPQAAQESANFLSNHFQKSWVAELQRRAQLGPASLMTIDPSKRMDAVRKQLQDRNVVIEQIDGLGGTLGDILHAISSAPAASLMAMNKNHPAWKTNKLMREFSGDPSRSGAFSEGTVWRSVGSVASMTPWGNVYLQANIKLARAFAKNPVLTTVGIFNSVGLPAMTATLWNAAAGPEYADYQFNRRSPDRQGSSIYIALPGKPPEMGLELPFIDPLTRPMKHGIEVLTGAQLGLMDGSLFKPGNEGLVQPIRQMLGLKGEPSGPADAAKRIELANQSPQVLAEMASKRQTSFGEGSVPRSILQQSVLPPVPPGLNAMVTAYGEKKMRSYIDSSPLMEGKNGFSNAEGKNPLRTWEYPQTEEVISALGADAMRFIYNVMADGVVGVQQGKGAGEVAGHVAKQYGQRVKDSTKYVSGYLFDQFQAISPATEAAGRTVKDKLDAVKTITEKYQEFTDKGAPIGAFVGSAKRGHQSLPSGAVNPVGPADTPMLALAEILSRYYPTLNNEYLGANKDAYEARARIANSIDMSPALKRAWMNHYSDEIIDRNRKLLQQMQLLESNLSKQFGVQVKLDKIDLNRGIEQFKPMMP